MKIQEIAKPKTITIDRAVRIIDNNSEDALDLQRIRRALTAGNNDVMVLKTVDPSKLIGTHDSDVESDYASPDKGPIFVDSKNNIVDGRHRASLAYKNKEQIEAWVPANIKELVADFKKNAPQDR